MRRRPGRARRGAEHFDEQLAAWERFKFTALDDGSAWPHLSAKGFASVCVLDGAAADALTAIRFA